MDALLKQEFIDRVNKVPEPPSEAASKGTAFNEILDCLIMKRKPQEGIIIKTIRKGEDLYEAAVVSDMAKRLLIDVNTHTYCHTEHVTHTI